MRNRKREIIINEINWSKSTHTRWEFTFFLLVRRSIRVVLNYFKINKVSRTKFIFRLYMFTANNTQTIDCDEMHIHATKMDRKKDAFCSFFFDFISLIFCMNSYGGKETPRTWNEKQEKMVTQYTIQTDIEQQRRLTLKKNYYSFRIVRLYVVWVRAHPKQIWRLMLGCQWCTNCHCLSVGRNTRPFFFSSAFRAKHRFRAFRAKHRFWAFCYSDFTQAIEFAKK